MALQPFVDLAFVRGSDGVYDIALDAGNRDALTTDGLESAIFVSLFTDRRASSDEVASPMKRRGWIGDLVSDIAGDRFGSGLWLYEQSRLTPDVIAGIQAEAHTALQWLVDDGLVSSVVVNVDKNLAQRALYLNVIVGLIEGGVSQHAFILASATRTASIG